MVRETLGYNEDLRSRLDVLLLGSATPRERRRVLREWRSAPSHGHAVPPGRGVFESVGGVTEIVQIWYADEERHVEVLNQMRAD